MVKKMQPSKKLYIFCEGLKTEPNYLENYISNTDSKKKEVIEVPRTRKNTPVQLVDEAIKKKKSAESAEGDEFWVVYDRESVIKYKKELHDKAWDKARANGINVAISNVCFEVWILLHFEYSAKPYSSYDDLISNSNLKANLKRLGIEKYEKGCKDIYFYVRGGLSNARKRAKRLNEEMEKTSKSDRPYVHTIYMDFYKVLDAIDAFEP